MKWRILFWMALTVFVLLGAVMIHNAEAAQRSVLITRLNEYMDDASNRKMTEANKILFMDAVGRELGRAGLYIRRDTILLADSTELYTVNSDFAGIIHSAYIKRNYERTIMRVVDRDSVFNLQVPEGVNVYYVFVEEDTLIGVHNIPIRQDSLVLLYNAAVPALTNDTTEWRLADHWEDAALMLTAAKALRKVGTAEEQARAGAFFQFGIATLQFIGAPPGVIRQLGDLEP
jgi:hypothetical protein